MRVRRRGQERLLDLRRGIQIADHPPVGDIELAVELFELLVPEHELLLDERQLLIRLDQVVVLLDRVLEG